MLKAFLRITLFALLAPTVESFGITSTQLVDSLTGTEVYLNAPSPRYLYHWTKFSHLAQIAYNKKSGDRLTRFSGGIRHAAVSIYWPSLIESENGVLFTWTHPVTGMKGGPSENYGNALVKLKIDIESARTVRIKEKWNQNVPPRESHFPNLDVSKFDIVIRESGGIKEVMILNPKVILAFTADPNVLKPELTKELTNLKNPNFEYSESDVHFDRFAANDRNRKEYRDYAIATISDLIETGRELVPAFFLTDLTGSSTAPWEDVQQTKKRIEIKEFPLRVPQLKFDSQFRLRYNEYLGSDLASEILWNIFEKRYEKGLFENLYAIVENYHFRDLVNKASKAEVMTLRERIFSSSDFNSFNFELAIQFIQTFANQMKSPKPLGASSCRSITTR